MVYRAVFFDCMDTLIRMNIPSMDVYSDWAHEGARDTSLWSDASAFREDWEQDREDFVARHGSLREDTIIARIRRILRARLARRDMTWPEKEIESCAERIHAEFWRRYRDASFVLPEVPRVLEEIRAAGFKVGVASNFMVPRGIEELLEQHGLFGYFSEVVVSCDVGWRKPAEVMYSAVMRAAGCAPEALLFVGDNPLADYDGPRLMGFATVLYDPDDANREIERRIRSFDELPAILSGSKRVFRDAD